MGDHDGLERLITMRGIRTEGGIVDLGPFRELLFDHDDKRQLRIRVESDGVMAFGRDGRQLVRQSAPGPACVAIELAFGRDRGTGEVVLDAFDLAARQHGRIATFLRDVRPGGEAPDESPRPFPDQDKTRGRVRHTAHCAQVSTSTALWEPIYKSWHDERNSIVTTLQAKSIGLFWDLFSSIVRGREMPNHADVAVTLKDTVAFYSSDFSLSAFVERFVSAFQKSRVDVDGFLPVKPISNHLPEVLGFAGGTWVPASLPGLKGLNLQVLDIASLASEAGVILEEDLQAVFPMGPWRRPPQRWYIFSGTRPGGVGYQGELLPDLLFREPDLVAAANLWLDRLEIGYRLEIQPIGREAADLFEVRLVDTRRQSAVDVAISDVGFGVSQVLPFLVQCLAANNQLISIEQPEVHIHPKLQADLGDVLAHTIRPPYSNRFLIETHSEHLVLRIQKLVRDGTLKPEDISIVFATRDPDGSRIQQIRIDEEGDFIDDWPGGFFPERLRELR
jgi:hypothetical protein